ncbi:MAG: helix-turn-helix domain-containing protein [Bacteroidota bacterium]
MDAPEIQQQLFQLIKRKLSSETSVADEIATLLEISSDSAYRRMRGEKIITFDELYKIATHYNISLDQIMGIELNGFLFQGNLMNSKTFRFDAYLTNMMHTLAYFNSFAKKEIYYLCKETPVFNYFHVRDLAAFKYFFWMGTLIFFPEFKNKKVNLDEYPDELFEIGKKVVGLYNQIDSSEIWNIESWNSTLHQVDYYLDSQMFQSDADALRVYEAMEKLLNHLEEQARRGYKFNIDDPAKKPLGKYNMYFNEIVLLDNSTLILLDNAKMASLAHTSINFMVTRDINYCEHFYNYVQNLVRRSTLISEVSEKERARYFRRMHERIDKRKESLKA